MQTDRIQLKSYFETGDTPTEAQFIDLIDSFLNFTDDNDPYDMDQMVEGTAKILTTAERAIIANYKGYFTSSALLITAYPPGVTASGSWAIVEGEGIYVINSNTSLWESSGAGLSDAQVEAAYNNQVAIVSTVDAEAGTSTTVFRWTPERVAEAIAALSSTMTDAEVETAYNNEVAIVSTVDAEAGTSTTVYRWTPERVAEAIAALAPGGGGSGLTRATSTSLTVDLASNRNLHIAANGDGLTGDITLSLTIGRDGNEALIKHNDATVPSITGATVNQLRSLASNYIVGADNYIIISQIDVNGTPEVTLWIAENATANYATKTFTVNDYLESVSSGAIKQTLTNGTNSYRVASFDPGDRVLIKALMPYDYDGGPVRFRAKWESDAGTAGDKVGWEFAGVCTKDDIALDATLGTAIGVYDTVTSTGQQMVSGATTDVTIANIPVAEDSVFIEVTLASDSESNAHLHDIEMQYPQKTVQVGQWTPSDDGAPVVVGLLMDGIAGTHYGVYDHKRRYAAASEFGIIRETTGDTDLTVGFDGTLWQNASQITTHLSGGGGALKEWKDQTPNGRHLSQPDNAKQPIVSLTGGIYEGLFDPASTTFLAGALDETFEAIMDYYIVFQEDPASNTGIHRQLVSSNLTSTLERHYIKEISAFMSMHGTSQVYTNIGSARNDTRVLYTFRFNGVACEIRRNGVVQTLAASSDCGTAIMEGFTIGATAAKTSNFWHGQILSLIATSRLSDTDRDTIEAALISDYSL